MDYSYAVVTGASSGIGAEVCRLLCESGVFVYGVGRDFSKNKFSHRLFCRTELDIGDTKALKEFACRIKSESKIKILVNCAGNAFFGLHESMNETKIHSMVAANIEAPMMLTAFLMKDIREQKGTIVNVSSVTAKSGRNTHGCAYGATKAALTSFGSSLFEEVRRHGVKVCNIHPDLTDTELYRNADFTVSGDKISCLAAEEVAAVIMQCINSREGMVFTDITVRPSLNVIKKKRV